jgi:hypothetical protein
MQQPTESLVYSLTDHCLVRLHLIRLQRVKQREADAFSAELSSKVQSLLQRGTIEAALLQLHVEKANVEQQLALLQKSGASKSSSQQGAWFSTTQHPRMCRRLIPRCVADVSPDLERGEARPCSTDAVVEHFNQLVELANDINELHSINIRCAALYRVLLMSHVAASRAQDEVCLMLSFSAIQAKYRTMLMQTCALCCDLQARYREFLLWVEKGGRLAQPSADQGPPKALYLPGEVPAPLVAGMCAS